MKGISMRRMQIFWLIFLALEGCFVNYPIYYGHDEIIKTEESLTDFVSFTREKDIQYKSSLGSLRNLGMVSSAMIPLESYGDIFEDQVPGKAGVDEETKNYRALPFNCWGAQTGTIPVSIKGHIKENSKKSIIILHGLLFSKRTTFIREFADVAYSQWNFSVITIDLRGHGENLIYPETSVGIYEALDVCYLAKKLKTECGMEYVGVIGFSYGAHTAIRAAYEASWEAKVSGGAPVIDAAVSISPPCDMDLAFGDLSPTGIGRVTNNFFSGLFLTRVAALKDCGFIPENLEIKNFRDYIDRLVIPYYKNAYNVPDRSSLGSLYRQATPLCHAAFQTPYDHLAQKVRKYEKDFQETIHSADDLLKMASTAKLLPEITIPLLVIHSEDDTTVAVRHSQIIAEAAKEKKLKNILVIIVPDGGHIAMHKVDPNWTFNTVYAFHYYYANPANRMDFQVVEQVGTLWYYFDRVLDIRMFRLGWTFF